MRSAAIGRVVFGASAVLFGVIALLWWDAYTWQYLSVIWHLPLGKAVGGLLMGAQIAGGIGIAVAVTVRPASRVLIAVYAAFALAAFAGIVTAPKSYGSYASFFEQFSLLSGSLAVTASVVADRDRAARLATLARFGFGISTISFAVAQIVYLKFTAQFVPAWLPPGQTFWAILTTVAFALAAIALLSGLCRRLAGRLLTAMLLSFGAIVWLPRVIAHPQVHFFWSEFALTMLIAGAAWVVAELADA